MTAQEIREKLEPMNLQHVAKAVGIHPNSLYRFMRGETDPKHSTVQKLAAWLERD